MVDEIYDRMYREGRKDLDEALSSLVGNAVRSVLQSFEVLHRVEWNAPWQRNDTGHHA